MEYTEFLSEIKKTRRESTYNNYRYALAHFPKATEEEIIDFISDNSIADTSKKAYLRVLHIALEYYGKLNRQMRRIINTYRPDESLQECPTEEQIERVWSNLKCTRDRAMFALMAYMGLRIGEVHRLNKNDITDDGRVILRKTKGHRPDIMPMIHERVEQSIREYLGERGEDFVEALFVGRGGNRLSLGYIKNLFRKEFIDNGMPQLHPHSLRRYFANMMYSNGVSLLDMQDNMRHASADTTRRYLNLSQQNRIESMKQTWGKNVSRRFA